MNKKLQVFKYVIFDLLSAATSWTLFYIFRKIYFESEKFGIPVPIELGINYFIGITVIPLFWIMLYAFTGFYNNIFRKSRLIDLGHTFFITLIGVVVIFFVLLLDDTIVTYTDYYTSLLVLFTVHFFLTFIPRLILTSVTVSKIQRGLIGFNTLIIGGNGRAVRIIKEMNARKRSAGNRIIGYVNVNHQSEDLAGDYIEHLGSIDDVTGFIKKHKIEEVIIAIESTEQDTIGNIINRLTQASVRIKAIPSTFDLLTGRVKISSLYGTPLLEISPELIPFWQYSLKKILDIVISILCLVILSPLILLVIIGIKCTSNGPVMYSHERIGRFGKPFRLYKFRTMVVNAEKNGPELSSKEDNRITPFGRFMRKHRFDEIPNFINVLKGEMSLVGPRPERKFFIDKIVQRAPEYLQLQKVKPGITSWGQVKFGYAENVDEMIERMRYDLIYIENMSIYVDFKIMIYTLITILKGRGI